MTEENCFESSSHATCHPYDSKQQLQIISLQQENERLKASLLTCLSGLGAMQRELNSYPPGPLWQLIYSWTGRIIDASKNV